MDLIRDVLDKKVVDRNGREMGRVDRVILGIRPNAPPRIVALELGPAVLASRISPMLGRWIEALEHVFGVDEGRPLRIPFAKILDIHDHVKVDDAFGETPAANVERWLRRWVGALPRSS